MKKVKILLLIMIIILMSGCTGKYNININEDLSVDESVNLKIEQGENVYEKTIQLFESNKISPKKYDVKATEKYVKVKYTEKYDSIEEYVLESKLYRILFDEIKFSNNRKRINMEADSKFLLTNNNSEYIVNDLNINSLDINIKTPYTLTKNNADKKNKDNYTWKINSNNKQKNIMLELNIGHNKNTINHILVIVLITIIVLFSSGYLIYNFMIRQKME